MHYYITYKLDTLMRELISSGNQTALPGANVVSSTGGGSTVDTGNSSTVNNVVITSGYSVPEIDHDPGAMFYVENRRPITTTDQTENIKLIINFYDNRLCQVQLILTYRPIMMTLAGK